MEFSLIFSYFSPFHCAAENGHSGIIELLLPLNDIDINSKTIFLLIFLIQFQIIFLDDIFF